MRTRVPPSKTRVDTSPPRALGRAACTRRNQPEPRPSHTRCEPTGSDLSHAEDSAVGQHAETIGASVRSSPLLPHECDRVVRRLDNIDAVMIPAASFDVLVHDERTVIRRSRSWMTNEPPDPPQSATRWPANSAYGPWPARSARRSRHGLRMSSAVRRCTAATRAALHPAWSKEPSAASSSAATSFRVGKMASGSPDWSSSSTRSRDARTTSRRVRVPIRVVSSGAEASSTVSRSSTAAMRFASTVQPPST
jgi:hypothetical protein